MVVRFCLSAGFPFLESTILKILSEAPYLWGAGGALVANFVDLAQEDLWWQILKYFLTSTPWWSIWGKSPGG